MFLSRKRTDVVENHLMLTVFNICVCTSLFSWLWVDGKVFCVLFCLDYVFPGSL